LLLLGAKPSFTRIRHSMSLRLAMALALRNWLVPATLLFNCNCPSPFTMNTLASPSQCRVVREVAIAEVVGELGVHAKGADQGGSEQERPVQEHAWNSWGCGAR
jgi:hypothetical protein